MRNWIDFWDGEHAIYVNDRHKAAHSAAVAADIRWHIRKAGMTVLDYGCGEAHYAESVAQSCQSLILCDAAPRVRAALAARLTGIAATQVMAPEAVVPGGIPPVDLLVANSLLQYIPREQLPALLGTWRSVLAPGGRLVIADVVPPGVSPVTDAMALLRFGWRDGFMLPAAAGLVRTALSDYSRIRKRLGFSMYSEEEVLAVLRASGLSAQRVYPNFGHNPARMTFEAQRSG